MSMTVPSETIPSIDYRVALEALISYQCPRSLSVAIMLRYSCWDEIVNLQFKPEDYNDLVTARNSFCATELLRKATFLPTNIDRDKVAYEAFHAAERVCEETNRNLLGGNLPVQGILYASARKISRILGDFSADELLNSSGWGPGVTLTIRGSSATLFEKFRHDGEVTPAFYDTCSILMNELSPHWRITPRLYEGNRVITVPKSAKTNRVIAVEPSLNLFFQKGVGTMIRRRLKRWGVDLTDQNRNQELARSGSFSNSLCTVDFSAASDTISWVLVQQLIPDQWFCIMDKLRSPRGLVGNSLIEYEKFSSMGNGFTFELESLIFYSIALSVAAEAGMSYDNISVYGDDVILPTCLYERYSEVTSLLGFTVNKKKSYSSSYFRESCGGYFWNGVSIKPPRIVDSLSLRNNRIAFHNRLHEYCSQEEFRQDEIPAMRILRASTKGNLSCPREYGDVGFWVPLTIVSGSYKFNCLQYIPDKHESEGHEVLLTHLYLLRNRDSNLISDVMKASDGASSIGNTIAKPRSGRYVRKNVSLPVVFGVKSG